MLWFAVGCVWYQSSIDISSNVCSYYLSSVLVAEWPYFGKELLSRLTICFLCNLTFCNFSYFPFWFEGWIWVLIASVPDVAYFLLLNMMRVVSTLTLSFAYSRS